MSMGSGAALWREVNTISRVSLICDGLDYISIYVFLVYQVLIFVQVVCLVELNRRVNRQ